MLKGSLEVYIYIIVARALISWVNPDPYNPIVRFLYNVTEPVLSRLRRLVRLQFGGIDLTPLALILILYLVQYFIGIWIFRLDLRHV
jgi:YggT family protein